MLECHICALVGNSSAVKEQNLICENVFFPLLLHIYVLASAYIFGVFVFFFPEFFQSPTVRVSVSSAEEQETMFACLAKDFSPKDYKFKWFKNNKEVTSKISQSDTPVKEESNTSKGTLYSAASFLTVSSSEWTVENTVFTCQLNGRGKNSSPVQVNSSITYKIQGPCKSYSFY